MEETPNYQLKKIELTDSPPDITVINDNWDTIDEELKQNSEGLTNLQNETENWQKPTVTLPDGRALDVPGDDVHNITKTGFYRTVSSTANTPGVGGSGSTIIANVYNEDSITLLFLGRTLDVMFTKRKSAGTWGPWVKYWSEANDGKGSGLDADLLAGIASDSFIYGDNHRGTINYTGNLNNITKSGFYYAHTGHTNGIGTNGFLIHNNFDGSDAYCSQILVPIGTNNTMFIRMKNNNNWHPWKEIQSYSLTNSDGSTKGYIDGDMNAVTEPGFYGYTAVAGNKPTTSLGILEVFKRTTSNYILQRATSMGPSEGPRTFSRQSIDNGATWSVWKESGGGGVGTVKVREGSVPYEATGQWGENYTNTVTIDGKGRIISILVRTSFGGGMNVFGEYRVDGTYLNSNPIPATNELTPTYGNEAAHISLDSSGIGRSGSSALMIPFESTFVVRFKAKLTSAGTSSGTLYYKILYEEY